MPYFSKKILLQVADKMMATQCEFITSDILGPKSVLQVVLYLLQYIYHKNNFYWHLFSIVLLLWMLMCNLMFLLGQRWPHIPEAEGASEGWCDILLQVSFSILHFIIIYINNVYLGAGSGLKSRAAAVLKQSSSMYLSLLLNKTRAVDPYSFYAEPDLDPAYFWMQIRIQV